VPSKVQQLLLGIGTVRRLPAKVRRKFATRSSSKGHHGQDGADVPESEGAKSTVFGSRHRTNEFSARDLQPETGARDRVHDGKNPDGFFPIGPYWSGRDMSEDPPKAAIRPAVNGEQRHRPKIPTYIPGRARFNRLRSSISPEGLATLLHRHAEGRIGQDTRAEQVWSRPETRSPAG